jgi:hypothetical protein
MLIEYLWYALIGLVVVLAFAAMLLKERARRAAEARMTPEQREVERRERAAFRRIGSGFGP